MKAQSKDLVSCETLSSERHRVHVRSLSLPAFVRVPLLHCLCPIVKRLSSKSFF